MPVIVVIVVNKVGHLIETYISKGGERTLLKMATIAAIAVMAGCGGNSPIQEDEPGWNCHTMGNKICGKDLAPNGKWVLVNTNGTYCWRTVVKGNFYDNLCHKP